MRLPLPEKYRRKGKQPAEYATIFIKEEQRGTEANDKGRFTLQVPAGRPLTFRVSHVGSVPIDTVMTLAPGEQRNIVFILRDSTLGDVNITGQRYRERREEVSVYKIDPLTSKVLPSPFGDFNKVLATLPGVVSNNELSSQYSVRGGSYDENLVYVNDMEIYRPYIVRSGQQEGLSFVNPDLTADVTFSAGGWQPRYGDKLSSVLNIEYKEPDTLAGSVSLGVLTNALHLEGATKNDKLTFLLGARQKSGRYLLGGLGFLEGLDTEGQYFPNFYDVQSYTGYKISNKTNLGLLVSYAQNDYELLPSERETTFGSITSAKRVNIFFDGSQKVGYRTTQAGLRLRHRFSDKVKSSLTVSGVYSFEREKNSIISTYRLCDVQTDPGRSNFNECIFTRAAGQELDYGRNDLDVQTVQVLQRNYYLPNARNEIEWGVSGSQQQFDDRLYEYVLNDSADYTSVTSFLQTENDLSTTRLEGYAQHSWYITEELRLTYGGRLTYWSYSNNVIASPRTQLSYQPNWKRDIIFRAAAGLYVQPPLYRELRRFDGTLNEDIKPQRSWHYIAGSDYNFKAWGRPFKFTAEAYYKQINDAIAYIVDDIRVRYVADNLTTAYATGLDLRVSGEFIEGEESWFSLSVMDAKENWEGDNVGYVNRPTRQLVTASIFFQDHLPIDPGSKVYLNFNFGTGFNHGPPDDFDNRSNYSFTTYRRVDIGFAKIINLKKDQGLGKHLNSLWLGLDVLNMLGVQNVISYTWIKDVYNVQWAVPNASSNRFFNLRVQATF